MKSSDPNNDSGNSSGREERNELTLSVGQLEGKEIDYLLFFLENDAASRNSDENNKVPPCSCSSSTLSSTSSSSSSSSSSSRILYSSESTENSTDGKEVKSHDDSTNVVGNERTHTGRSATLWGTKDVSEYAVARSRIATEAANEALRRQAIRPHAGSYTLTSFGLGSSTADAIHERDERPLWKQGYDKDDDDDDESTTNVDHKPGMISDGNAAFQSPIASIVEQAAALGLLKLQNRKQEDQQQRSQKNAMLVNGNDPLHPKSNTKMIQSNGIEGCNAIKDKGKEEGVLDLANDLDDGTDSNSDGKVLMDVVVETASLIEIESNQQPWVILHTDCDDDGGFTEGESIRNDKDSPQEEKASNEINGETKRKVLDSDGETSTIASSIQDSAATISAATRVFVTFAWTLGRISSKLKRMRLRESSEMEKES